MQISSCELRIWELQLLPLMHLHECRPLTLLYVGVGVGVGVLVCGCGCVCACSYVCARVCVLVCVRPCVCVCVCAYVHACVCIGLACTESFGQPTPLQTLVNSDYIDDAFSICFGAGGNGGFLTLVSTCRRHVALPVYMRACVCVSHACVRACVHACVCVSHVCMRACVCRILKC